VRLCQKRLKLSRIVDECKPLASGAYNETTGTYVPGKWIHHLYWLHPTSFYASVIRDIRRRSDMKIYVFCENMDNPSCDFFAKLSDVDDNIEMRVGQPLLDDLHMLLCASEVATSNGSFQRVFNLSQRLGMRHTFALTPPSSCSSNTVVSENVDNRATLPTHSKTFRWIRGTHELQRHARFQPLQPRQIVKFYWIKHAKERALFAKTVQPWRNSGMQRYTINAHRSISSCSNTTLHDHRASTKGPILKGKQSAAGMGRALF